MFWLIGGAVFVLIVFGWLGYELKNAPVLEEPEDE